MIITSLHHYTLTVLQNATLFTLSVEHFLQSQYSCALQGINSWNTLCGTPLFSTLQCCKMQRGTLSIDTLDTSFYLSIHAP